MCQMKVTHHVLFCSQQPKKVGLGYINGIHKLIKNTYYSYVKKMKSGDHIQRDKTAANTKEATHSVQCSKEEHVLQ